ncbi:hypothetical protein HID58_043947, partial [Brassica napus]
KNSSDPSPIRVSPTPDPKQSPLFLSRSLRLLNTIAMSSVTSAVLELHLLNLCIYFKPITHPTLCQLDIIIIIKANCYEISNSRRCKSLIPTMANSYTLLASLMAGRCSNTAEVHLLRFWEAWNKKGGELMMSTCSSLMSKNCECKPTPHVPCFVCLLFPDTVKSTQSIFETECLKNELCYCSSLSAAVKMLSVLTVHFFTLDAAIIQSAYQVRGHNPFRFHKKEAAEESTGNTVEKLQGAKNGGFFIKVESMCVCVDICYLEAELLLPDVEWMSRTNIPNEYMYRD